MRPVSEAWAAAIAEPHRIATRLTLIDGDVETELEDVAVEGRVDLDSGAAIRGRCDLTIVGDLVPTTATDPLAPYGNEIRVERGLTYPDGTVELASLGVFRIDETDAEASDEGTVIRVSGFDRAARIIDARFEEAGQIAEGTVATTAIAGLLVGAYPEVVMNFAASALTTGTHVYEVGDDPWALAQSIATGMGMELYFDGDGEAVLRPFPTATEGQAIADIVEGDGGTLISARRRNTRQGAYNRGVVIGESAQTDAAPVRGVATDDNPLSPTYYYGPFGKVPTFLVSEFVTTQAQADDAAAALLARQLGTSQQVSFVSVVNPALEPSDVVGVTCSALGIDGEQVIDTLTIPLEAAAAMSGDARATQVTS